MVSDIHTHLKSAVIEQPFKMCVNIRHHYSSRQCSRQYIGNIIWKTRKCFMEMLNGLLCIEMPVIFRIFLYVALDKGVC